jgi:hypothetical protein
MSKFAQGPYTVKNTAKYVGKGVPRYRSGWELSFMRFLDNNDSVMQWASESIQIPYRNPVTGKQSIYIPDFLVTYRTRNNKLIAEVIEIKPRKQSVIEGNMSNKDRMVVAVNYAKWDQATKWCARNGLKFRVATEYDLFQQAGSKR